MTLIVLERFIFAFSLNSIPEAFFFSWSFVKIANLCWKDHGGFHLKFRRESMTLNAVNPEPLDSGRKFKI